MKKTLLCGLLVLSISACAFPLDRAHFNELNKKAAELRKNHDWNSLRTVLLEIGQELQIPTPTFMLRMALVETHLNHKTEALRWMERYAATGLTYDIASDEDLKILATEPGFHGIAATMRARTARVAKTEVACKLPLVDLMPEDITFEKSRGTFVVSSVQHHTLYRISLPQSGERKCGIAEIPLPESVKRWPVLPVSHDPRRDLLWFGASAMPDFANVSKEDNGKASLFAVDAQSGQVVRRFDMNEDGPAVLGDMSVADGTVYVTDSIGGGVYRVQDKPESELEKITGGFVSPQTPVLARDGKRLFVADYALGIGVVAITKESNGQLTFLPHPEGVATTGIDGLYLDGNSLIAIQNGTEPERIVRLRLNSSQTRIISMEVVEQSTKRLGEPTHAVAANGMIYVIANVGWDKVDEHGRLKPGEHFTAPILLRFPSENQHTKDNPR